MGNPVQVQVLLSARKLREVHSGVWAADASLLAGRRITIRVYTAIAVGQAPLRGACMHFARKDNKSALSKDLLVIRVGLFCVLTSHGRGNILKISRLVLGNSGCWCLASFLT